MATSNLTAVGRSDEEQRESAQSRDVVQSRRNNIRMVQNVLLVWLDNSIDESSTDCRNIITQLRRAISTLNTFTDSDQCLQYLETIEHTKICLMIPGYLGQRIMLRVHNMSQIDSIVIFCGNKNRHEQWAKEWPKIKGVFTEIGSICEVLKKAAQRCEQNSMSISFMAISDDVYKKKLDQLDPSFMYTQILKEILLTIKFEQQHIKEFIQYCRDVFADNEEELENVKKLEREYHDKTPIWWYTCQCFLYPMLNRALRLMDADIIVKMGFFIDDLHQHIEELHRKEFGDYKSSDRFTVYRGQGLSKADFQQMSKMKDGLMSFNSFLSTSKKRNVSLGFAELAMTNSEMVGILFVIAIDPEQSNTPFASIASVSCFEDTEDEVLFSMHTVFRINEITPLDENSRLFQVQLTLTNDNDNAFRALSNYIREETFPNDKGWFRLGLVLRKIGQYDKAQQVYEILLEQATDENEMRRIYEQLGYTHDDKGDYREAITSYKKSLEISEKTLSPTHPNLASIYNNIGAAYLNLGDYQYSPSFYEKALAIQQQSLPPNHPDLAVTYNNMADLCCSLENYPKALSFHEKALAIQQESLPPNHPDLASTYNRIGGVYQDMNDYPKALSSAEKALAIKQYSLPPNHLDLATSYHNIGTLHANMNEYTKALPYLEKAQTIWQQSLHPNHRNIAMSLHSIGSVYRDMGDFSKAHSFFERTVNIEQQSLSQNYGRLLQYQYDLESVEEKL